MRLCLGLVLHTDDEEELEDDAEQKRFCGRFPNMAWTGSIDACPDLYKLTKGLIPSSTSHPSSLSISFNFNSSPHPVSIPLPVIYRCVHEIILSSYLSVPEAKGSGRRSDSPDLRTHYLSPAHCSYRCRWGFSTRFDVHPGHNSTEQTSQSQIGQIGLVKTPLPGLINMRATLILWDTSTSLLCPILRDVFYFFSSFFLPLFLSSRSFDSKSTLRRFHFTDHFR